MKFNRAMGPRQLAMWAQYEDYANATAKLRGIYSAQDVHRRARLIAQAQEEAREALRVHAGLIVS